MTTTNGPSASPELEAATGWLGTLTVGPASSHESLAIFPLIAGRPGEPGPEADGPPAWDRYTLLSDAIAAGEARVEEVSEAGAVPFLAVVNEAAKPILIPEGEILIGAKQNRTVNLTVLVAAGATHRLGVSCVERGRWSYERPDLRPEAFAHPTLREKKLRSALRERKLSGMALSDQGEVWAEVSAHLETLGTRSASADVVDAYEAAGDRLEAYRKGIPLPAGAVGFVAVDGGEVVGLDLFDSPRTLATLWPRLADAYFIRALARQGKEAVPMPELAERFLAAVVDSLEPSPRQPEVGFELEAAGDDLSGTALFYAGAVCHLAAFPAARPAAGNDDFGAPELGSGAA